MICSRGNKKAITGTALVAHVEMERRVYGFRRRFNAKIATILIRAIVLPINYAKKNALVNPNKRNFKNINLLQK
jgi:hypothetical protein